MAQNSSTSSLFSPVKISRLICIFIHVGSCSFAAVVTRHIKQCCFKDQWCMCVYMTGQASLRCTAWIPYSKYSACNIHVLCKRQGKHASVTWLDCTRMFNAACRDLGHFPCMLHVHDMHINIQVTYMQKGSLPACCMHVHTRTYIHIIGTCMSHACTVHFTQICLIMYL